MRRADPLRFRSSRPFTLETTLATTSASSARSSRQSSREAGPPPEERDVKSFTPANLGSQGPAPESSTAGLARARSNGASKALSDVQKGKRKASESEPEVASKRAGPSRSCVAFGMRGEPLELIADADPALQTYK